LVGEAVQKNCHSGRNIYGNICKNISDVTARSNANSISYELIPGVSDFSSTGTWNFAAPAGYFTFEFFILPGDDIFDLQFYLVKV
jgi:hypothetical protein